MAVRQKALLPVYLQVARQFADMHDTPARMHAKGVLRGVVPWREARSFFAQRLKRRLAEAALVRQLALADNSIAHHEAVAMVGTWASDGVGGGMNGSIGASASGSRALSASRATDGAFLSWVQSSAGQAKVEAELRGLRSAAAARVVHDMLASPGGKEEFLSGLVQVLHADSALAAQLQQLLSEQQARQQ